MRQIAPKLILFCIALLLAAVLGEIVVRTVMPQDVGIWRTSRDGLITLRPGIDVDLPSFGQNVQTNDLGFRDAQRSHDAQPGVFRIIVLGDSFMEALQVASDDALPSSIARILSTDSGQAVEVINAGVSGWGTEDQLTWFRRVGKDLNPDLVLVAMTLHNDVSDNLRLRFHNLRDGLPVEKPVDYLPMSQFVELEIKGWLAFHSQLYRLVTITLRNRRYQESAVVLNDHVAALFKPYDEQIERGWNLTTEFLDNLQSAAADIGATTAVFLIPLRLQLSDAALGEFLTSQKVSQQALDSDSPQNRMIRWGKSSRVTVIDLLPIFRTHASQNQDMLYLPADGHWGEIGHALAAKTVSQELIDSGLLLPPEGR